MARILIPLLIAGLVGCGPQGSVSPTRSPSAHGLVFKLVGLLRANTVNSATRGPDGQLWLITEEISGGRIGSTVWRFPIAGDSSRELTRPDDILGNIVTGPDGNLWFTDVRPGAWLIDKLKVGGSATEYALHTEAFSLTTGPDGAIWFTEQSADRIGRATTAGQVTEYPLPPAAVFVGCGGRCPDTITTGPDGALWFTENQVKEPGHRIGRVTVGGRIREFTPLGAQSGPYGIASNGGSLCSVKAGPTSDASQSGAP